jgi:hypothetical protein
MFGVSENYVRTARDLLDEDPPATDAVRQGTRDLKDAHEDLRPGRDKTDARP